MEVLRPVLIKIGGRIYRKNFIREQAHQHEEEEDFNPGIITNLQISFISFVYILFYPQMEVQRGCHNAKDNVKNYQVKCP